MRGKMIGTKWIALGGKIRTEGNKLIYVPSILEEGQYQGQHSVCIAKSNIDFDSGKIQFQVTFKDQKSKCQLILSHGNSIETCVGYNFGNSAFGISNYQNTKWDAVMLSGDSSSIPVKQKIKTEITVLGSSISLFVDGVKVCSGNSQTVRSQLGFLMMGESEIEIESFSVSKTPPKAFVVMQFSSEFNELYEEVIKPTCEKFSIEVIRADDMYTNTLILEDIMRSINESSLVIADITVDNPNVFYEVGYSHAIKKPTILLSDRKRGKLPFDVSGFRTLFYENSIGGKRAVEENLEKYLRNLNI